MSNTLLFCPNCNCIAQEHCMSNMGLPMRNTFRCTTCNEVYANYDGVMVTLASGDRAKHKGIL